MDNSLQENSTPSRQAAPCVLVIAGATGDLATRKLAPALWRLWSAGQLPAGFAVVGLGRRPRSDQEFRDVYRQAIKPESGWDDFAAKLFYHVADVSDPADIAGVAVFLKRLRAEHDLAANTLFYLATPADMFTPIVQALGSAGLVCHDPRLSAAGECWARVIVEKPFGRDLASARELNEALRTVFGEVHTYRIDHYLGKETVQNMLVMRFANSIFELMWNREHIDNVQITVAETLGIEGRGEFFEQTGILRDVAQNHLMQLLCLTAMEPPVGSTADSIRDEKAKVIRSLRRLRVEDVVAGQYSAGRVGGQTVPGYRQEPNVAADSTIETYLAVRAHIDNWRWAGVPFYLRCGKRLANKSTQIVLTFRRPPVGLFAPGRPEPNRLFIRIQPNEGASLHFNGKAPGPAIRLEPVQMDFRYGTSFAGPLTEAYQRLLLDVMAGDKTLFTRSDEVEESWQYFAPVLDAWADGNKKLATYPAGGWGPPEADALLAPADDRWHND